MELIKCIEASASAGDDDYVFQLAVSSDEQRLVSSLSSMCLGVHDLSDGLKRVSCIQAHSQRINCVETSRESPHAVISGSDDGYLKCWDVRTSCKEPVVKVKCGGEVTDASLGSKDLLVAAAVGTNVSFYDIRCIKDRETSSTSASGAACIGEYGDVHTETINAVKFHPTRDTELLTAGEDGLVCCYDTKVAARADSILGVINAECDVRTFGLFGPELEGVYCLSTVETASFWHLYSALRVVNLPGVRDTFQMDYLVDCVPSTMSSGGTPQILSGSIDGKGLLIDVYPDRTEKSLELRNGHSDVIRCGVRLRDGGLITGGEDSKICLFR